MIWHRKFNEFIWAQHIFSALYQRFRYVNFYIDLINDINQIIRTEGINNHIIHPVKLSAVRKDMRLILMTALRFKNQEFQISTACQSDAPNVLPIPDKRKCRKCEKSSLDHLMKWKGNWSPSLCLKSMPERKLVANNCSQCACVDIIVAIVYLSWKKDCKLCLTLMFLLTIIWEQLLIIIFLFSTHLGHRLVPHKRYKQFPFHWYML